MAFLQRGFAVLRQGVLANVRLAPGTSVFQGLTASQCQAVRGFADSSYLDKSDVTSRVLAIVKNFEKVDPAKVRMLDSRWWSYWARCGMERPCMRALRAAIVCWTDA